MALLLVGSGAVADPAPPLAELSLEELMEIEVTLVSRRPQKVSESAAAVTVVTRDELRRAGVRTLPDALRLVPGMQVSQIDANKWMVASRGFAGLFSNKLLVLIDGRSVYTPLFAGVFWESQDVPIEDLERIEVIRGPGSALWGANAVNGIINIVTRSAGETDGTLIKVGGGGERRFGLARHGFRLASGHLRTWVKHFDRGRSTPVAEIPVRDDWRMTRAGLRGDFELSARDELTILGGAYRGEIGQSLTYVSQPPPPLAQIHFFDVPIAGGELLARGRRRWDTDRETEVQLYYDLFDRDERLLQGRIHNADIDVQQLLRIGRHQLVFGSGYRRTWDDFAGSFTMWVEPRRRTTHLFSGFLHDDVEIVPDRLRVSAGAKVERNSYSGFEWQPNLRLWFAPRPQHDLWLAVSRPLRTPSRGDHDFGAALTALPPDSLFAGAPATLVLVDNSRRFHTERMLSVDGGYRAGLGSGWFADVALYYNRYADLLTQEPGLPYAVEAASPYLVVPVRTANLAQATAAGAELTLDWTASSTWQIRGIYSYLYLSLDLDDRSRDTVTKGFEGGSPAHQLGLRSLTQRGPWSLAVSGRWVSSLDDLDIDAYASLDASLSRPLGEDLELALTGRNLLEASHPEAVSNTIGAAPSAVEREAYLALTWKR